MNVLFLSTSLCNKTPQPQILLSLKQINRQFNFIIKQIEKTMSINKNQLYLKSLVIFILLFIFLSFPHCESKQQNQTAVNKGQHTNVLGCWKGSPVGRFADRSEQLRLIALKPDGNPAITLIYELGSRSRVWECDIAVTCQDSAISWEGHTGHLGREIELLAQFIFRLLLPAIIVNSEMVSLSYLTSLSERKDTITIIEEWKGEKSTWNFTRHKEADEFMQRLAASIGKEYIYEVPDHLDNGWDCADLADVGIDKRKSSSL